MKHSFFIFLASISLINSVAAQIPDDFGYIADEIPDIRLEIRYASKENFMGRVVNGYSSPKVVLTKKALSALKKAQTEFKQLGYGIKVFDAYRPQHAVDDFMQWIKVEKDTVMKHKYYPQLDKKNLVPQGYIAEKSGHSRGSTLDLSLVYLDGEKKGKEVDMGGEWDYFGKKSNYDYPETSSKQKENRALLQKIMIKHGFLPYAEEWWHFTLAKEPFPNQYFDF